MNPASETPTNARGLATLALRTDPPTKAQIQAGNELCNDLPLLMRKAIDAGLVLTAQALQEAVQHVGYEHGANLDRLLPSTPKRMYRCKVCNGRGHQADNSYDPHRCPVADCDDGKVGLATHNLQLQL